MPSPEEILDAATSFGDAVRKLREFRGMTLRELATRVGVSAPFLSDVEHDRRNTDKVAELAVALQVNEQKLKGLDARLPEDLKTWMSAHPSIIPFLQTLRDSGRDLDELIQSFQPRSRRGGTKRATRR